MLTCQLFCQGESEEEMNYFEENAHFSNNNLCNTETIIIHLRLGEYW